MGSTRLRDMLLTALDSPLICPLTDEATSAGLDDDFVLEDEAIPQTLRLQLRSLDNMPTSIARMASYTSLTSLDDTLPRTPSSQKVPASLRESSRSIPPTRKRVRSESGRAP